MNIVVGVDWRDQSQAALQEAIELWLEGWVIYKFVLSLLTKDGTNRNSVVNGTFRIQCV